MAANNSGKHTLKVALRIGEIYYNIRKRFWGRLAPGLVNNIYYLLGLLWLFYEVIMLLSLLYRRVSWKQENYFIHPWSQSQQVAVQGFTLPGCQTPDHILGCSVASFWPLNQDALNYIVCFVDWLSRLSGKPCGNLKNSHQIDYQVAGCGQGELILDLVTGERFLFLHAVTAFGH